jgi:hypothetical protein
VVGRLDNHQEAVPMVKMEWTYVLPDVLPSQEKVGSKIVDVYIFTVS